MGFEDEFGGQLFRRERKRTHLTELGRVMQEHLKRVDATTQDALIAARSLLNLEKAPLNVGIMCTIGPVQAIPFLSEFKIRHPGIELTLHDVVPGDMTEDLLSGKLDCALLGLPVELHERFDTEKLYTEPLVIIFPPNHRFESMNSIPLKEMAGEQYLERLNCEFRDIFFDLLEKNKIDVSVPNRSERDDWIQNMVLHGMGVCLIPEYSITLDGLQYRTICEPEISRSVELVTVSGHRRSPAVQAFISEANGYSWPV